MKMSKHTEIADFYLQGSKSQYDTYYNWYVRTSEKFWSATM